MFRSSSRSISWSIQNRERHLSETYGSTGSEGSFKENSKPENNNHSGGEFQLMGGQQQFKVEAAQQQLNGESNRM
jgi:hypothetical protein